MSTMTPDQELTTLLEECLGIANRLAGKVDRMSPEIAEEFDRECQRLADAVPRARGILSRVQEQTADEGLLVRVAAAEDLSERLEAQVVEIQQQVRVLRERVLREQRKASKESDDA